jgi:hypothetical protein
VEARLQSQGKRPKPCGFTDVLFGFGNSALNGNLLKDGFEFAQHGREIALGIMPMEMWELGFQLAIGFSPFDWLYDLGSFLAGRDIVSGAELTEFDKATILAGFLTLGFGDDVIKAGKALSKLKSLDEAAAVGKASKKLFSGGLTNLLQTRQLRSSLNKLSKRGASSLGGLSGRTDEAAEALAGASRGASHADEVAETVAEAGQGANHVDEVGEAVDNTRPLSQGLEASSFPTSAVCSFNSFTAGTPVETEEGQKPIEEVEVGDKVLAEDPETGQQGYFEVVALTNHLADEILKVTVEVKAETREKETETVGSSAEGNDDDDDKTQLNSKSDNQPISQLADQQATMNITPEHPVYVEGKGWIWTENLAVGDRLRRADGGWAKVLAVERVALDEPELVYNFMVKGPHTYFVLEVGVLVHNTSCSLGGVDETLLHLQENRNILKLRQAKLGLASPAELLIQIEDYEHAFDLGMAARTGHSGVDEFFEQTKRLDLNVSFNKSIIGDLKTQEDFEPLLLELHENLNILLERKAKFGIDVPLHLVNQIDDYKTAINLAEQGRAGQISIDNFIKETEDLILDHSFNNPIIIKDIRMQADFQPLIKKLNRGLNILQEQKAKFGIMVPLRLVNQIDDYKTAINLAKQGRAGQISIDNFIKETRPLIIDY